MVGLVLLYIPMCNSDMLTSVYNIVELLTKWGDFIPKQTQISIVTENLGSVITDD